MPTELFVILRFDFSFALEPYTRIKEQQHGEELQSADQHVEDQNDLGKAREKAEVLRGTDHGKSGTDVIDGCGDRGEAGRGVVSLDGDEQHGCRKQKDIGH